MVGLIEDHHPQGELPDDFRDRFALDHDHPPHLERPGDSPFATDGETGDNGEPHGHEHPPWTATSRGVEMSLRRLAMLEPVYRLAPDLISSGRVNWPVDDTAASREVRMTDFRLLRRGGFYQAVARYGEQVWTPFTYVALVSSRPCPSSRFSPDVLSPATSVLISRTAVENWISLSVRMCLRSCSRSAGSCSSAFSMSWKVLILATAFFLPFGVSFYHHGRVRRS